ncbi:MAG: outer membrane lipoprotein chaperone LolA [Pseudomonadota bacterium]
MKSLIFLLQIVLVLIFPVAGFCGDLAPVDIATKIQEKYEKTISFKADFLQTSNISGMQHRQRQGSGTMAIQKPSLLRWDYSTPDKQVLVSDGEEFSLYFASEKQMIVTPAKEYLQEDVTYSFFSGTGNLLRDFDVSDAPGFLARDGSYAITLKPKNSHPQVDVMYVWVDTGTFLINHLQIQDHLGSLTDLVFSNPVVDQPFPVEHFHFTPPEGTEIIRQ